MKNPATKGAAKRTVDQICLHRSCLISRTDFPKVGIRIFERTIRWNTLATLCEKEDTIIVRELREIWLLNCHRVSYSTSASLSNQNALIP